MKNWVCSLPPPEEGKEYPEEMLGATAGHSEGILGSLETNFQCDESEK